MLARSAPMVEVAPGFHTLKLKAGLLYEHWDKKFRTLIFGFVPATEIDLPAGYTHLGVVVGGEIVLSYGLCQRRLAEGDFFSVAGAASIKSSGGLGMVSSAHDYVGFNLFGGPLEEKGRLRYIDGCTDTLLVPPVRKGDACLNHLHFPPDIVQTPHTHPSVRSGIVYRGRGECVVPSSGEPVPLVPGYAFVIDTEAVHSFNTTDETMDIIAFHPDSDTGMTDDDHPMVNRTLVDGISARHLDAIRTR
jgi:quercetin dioxygenase-like cupin family protein